MSTIRKDPFGAYRVIIAESQPPRPGSLQPSEPVLQRGWLCPFCHGNESTTPPEIYAVGPESREANTSGWTLRIIPNKYTDLEAEGEPVPVENKLFHSDRAVGVHEILIETEVHDGRIERYPISKFEELARVFGQRIRSLYEDPRIQYVQIYRNEGLMAGAAIEHPHSHIVGLPFVPEGVQVQLVAAREFHEKNGACLGCQIVQAELELGERVVFENEHFLCFAPFASRVPYELAISPKQHHSQIQSLPEQQLTSLAEALQRSIWGLSQSLEAPAFNLIVRTAPKPPDSDVAGQEDYHHWRIEILPRTAEQTALTWGTRLHINSMPPEKAALQMRENLAKQPDPPSPLGG